jgi:hypothetical protein
LNKQNQGKLERREIEKGYLKTVLKTQIEGKKLKGEKRAEFVTNILKMNKLPFKIANFGKSEL